jgi:hypothetical protein
MAEFHPGGSRQCLRSPAVSTDSFVFRSANRILCGSVLSPVAGMELGSLYPADRMIP